MSLLIKDVFDFTTPVMRAFVLAKARMPRGSLRLSLSQTAIARANISGVHNVTLLGDVGYRAVVSLVALSGRGDWCYTKNIPKGGVPE